MGGWGEGGLQKFGGLALVVRKEGQSFFFNLLLPSESLLLCVTVSRLANAALLK